MDQLFDANTLKYWINCTRKSTFCCCKAPTHRSVLFIQHKKPRQGEPMYGLLLPSILG